MTDRDQEFDPDHELEPAWESDVEERDAKRRKMMMFGGATAAVLVGFVGLYALLNWVAGGLTGTDDPPQATRNGEGSTVAVDPGGGVVAPAPAPAVNASDLEWFAVESTVGFAQRTFVDDDGVFYALSTAPGRNFNWPPPKAIYTSTDGEFWDVIPLDDAQSAHDMAMRSGTIYLIGTSPANQDFLEPPEVVLSTSGDGGESWDQTLLETAAAPPNGAPVQWSNISMRLGTTADAVVAVVQSQFFLDYRRMVPNEFVGDGFDYAPTPDGVNVIDYMLIEQLYMQCEGEMEQVGGDMDAISDECRQLFEGGDNEMDAATVGFVSWEEMGLEDGSPPVFSELFVSTDGVTFEAVESPFQPGADVHGFYSTDNGIVAIEGGQMGQSVWRSQDGRTWEQEDALQAFDWITTAGTVEGRLVVVGQSRNGGQVAWENEAGEFDLVDMNEVMGVPAGLGEHSGWLSAASVGPMGVVTIFQRFDERAEREFTEVAIASDAETWSTVPLDAITGVSEGYSDWVAVGPTSIIIRYQSWNAVRPLNLQVIGSVAG